LTDPAPPAFLAAAASLQADGYATVAQFLEDADLNTGIRESAMDRAEDALYLAAELGGDDDAACQRFWVARQAIDDCRAWQDAHERFGYNRPGPTWDAALRATIADALVAVDWLRDNRPVHPDMARWTTGAHARVAQEVAK